MSYPFLLVEENEFLISSGYVCSICKMPRDIHIYIYIFDWFKNFVLWIVIGAK